MKEVNSKTEEIKKIDIFKNWSTCLECKEKKRLIRFWRTGKKGVCAECTGRNRL